MILRKSSTLKLSKEREKERERWKISLKRRASSTNMQLAIFL